MRLKVGSEILMAHNNKLVVTELKEKHAICDFIDKHNRVRSTTALFQYSTLTSPYYSRRFKVKY